MKQQAIKKYNSAHSTRRGCLILGVVELVLTYLFAIRAIDTASWWAYLLTLIFLVATMRSFVGALHPAFKKNDPK